MGLIRNPVLGSLNISDDYVFNGDPASFSRAPSLHPPRRSIEDFVELLQSRDLAGPVALHGDRIPLGTGSQFAVIKRLVDVPKQLHQEPSSFYAEEVAVKQPLFFLDPDRRIDLSDPLVRQQVHDMYLEVLVLCHPILRAHPNIVRLLAWALDTSIWRQPPVLVLELAIGNLTTFIQDVEDGLVFKKGCEDTGYWKVKHWLCLDVAAGLDAIHDCQIIHGDLKPDNILIFGRGDKAIAKIADFGLSLDEVVSGSSNLIGGTPGWRAPEIEEGRVVALELPQADNYSFGLLVWSTMFLTGTVPPRSLCTDRASLVAEAVNQKMDELYLSLGEVLSTTLPHLLDRQAAMRPLRVAESLRSDDRNYRAW